MGIFGKSANEKALELKSEADDQLIEKLLAENRALLAEVAKTGVKLTTSLENESIIGRQKAHLEAENHRLAAELARLTTRGPGGRFVKVEAQRTTGTAAAVQGVSHQPI